MKIENIEIDKIKEEEKVVHVEINYPKWNKVDTVEIGLCDVRAADNIRIKFDFDRDGWVIYQSRSYHPHIEGSTYGHEEEWIESAFCPAWKYELDEDKKFTYKPQEIKITENDTTEFLEDLRTKILNGLSVPKIFFNERPTSFLQQQNKNIELEEQKKKK